MCNYEDSSLQERDFSWFRSEFMRVYDAETQYLQLGTRLLLGVFDSTYIFSFFQTFNCDI